MHIYIYGMYICMYVHMYLYIYIYPLTYRKEKGGKRYENLLCMKMFADACISIFDVYARTYVYTAHTYERIHHENSCKFVRNNISCIRSYICVVIHVSMYPCMHACVVKQ